jgi:septum site-determining protein MinC
MTAPNSLLQIKGLRDGLLVSLNDASWEEQLSALLTQIDNQPVFFKGARLALDVSSQVLYVDDLVNLRDQLSDRGIFLWAILSESPATEQTAQLLGLATRISKPRPEDSREFSANDLGDESALFLDRTIRSGTRVEFAGHVVVLGDVNPGAEIIADGNVIIWGRLRGMVHAGSKGDRQAVICALDFSPMQLRIAEEAGSTTRSKTNSKPQVARIHEDGDLRVEDWTSS